MKIIHISPGSGDNFYCGNCLRDAELAGTMSGLGHEVLLIPMYLPGQFEACEGTATQSPIFFGGVNVYLQQKLSFFRRTPRWIDRIFDSPKLLAWVSKKAGTTNAKDLGETMISMLEGADGRQGKELNRLLDWLALPENRADVICLSNVLLAGLAGEIRRRLDVPVFCLLQDEDEFLDALEQPYREQAWDLLIECCRNIDGFISASKYYSAVMSKRLNIEAGRICTVYNGINFIGDQIFERAGTDRAIGYLSRMSPDKGLDLLADAFIDLKRNGFDDLKLKVTGGKTQADEGFIKNVQKKLDQAGVADDVEFLDDFSPAAKREFFKSITVLSVPERKPVSNSLYVLESLSWSVPVVQPGHGIFPEVLGLAGGGLLFEPGNVKHLTDRLREVLSDVDYAQELGRAGHFGVAENFSVNKTAETMATIYATATGIKSGADNA